MNKESQNWSQKLSGHLHGLQIFTLAIGGMIGITWITLLGKWIGDAGSIGALIAFVISGAIIGLVSRAYVYIANTLPVTGGEAAYAHFAIGPFAGFVTGWVLIYTYIAICAFLAISIGWVLGAIFPGVEGRVVYRLLGADVKIGTLLLGLAFTSLITVLQFRGTDMAARIQDVMTFLLIALCGAFILAGLTAGETENLKPYFELRETGWRWGGVVSVVALTPLVFGGFNFSVQALGERAPDASLKSIGRALYAAVAFGALFYVAIILSASLSAPREEILSAPLPAAAAFEAAFDSELLKNLVLGAGFLGLLTSWNACAFACARLFFFLGSQGGLPTVFARPHPRFGTPSVSILVIGLITMIGAFGGVGAIALLVGSASMTIAFAYLVVGVAAHNQSTRSMDPHGTFWNRISIIAGGFVFLTALTEPFVSRPEFHLPLSWAALLIWFVLGALIYAATLNKNA